MADERVQQLLQRYSQPVTEIFTHYARLDGEPNSISPSALLKFARDFHLCPYPLRTSRIRAQGGPLEFAPFVQCLVAIAKEGFPMKEPVQSVVMLFCELDQSEAMATVPPGDDPEFLFAEDEAWLDQFPRASRPADWQDDENATDSEADAPAPPPPAAEADARVEQLFQRYSQPVTEIFTHYARLDGEPNSISPSALLKFTRDFHLCPYPLRTSRIRAQGGPLEFALFVQCLVAIAKEGFPMKEPVQSVVMLFCELDQSEAMATVPPGDDPEFLFAEDEAWLDQFPRASRPADWQDDEPTVARVDRTGSTGETLTAAKKEASGGLVGIGLVLGRQEGRVRVLDLVAGGAAQATGRLQEVLSVNGQGVESLQFNEVLGLIRGPVGQSVSLALQESSGQRIQVEVERVPVDGRAAKMSLDNTAQALARSNNAMVVAPASLVASEKELEEA